MFGRKNTKPKNMKIKVCFSHLGCLSDLQRILSQLLDFYSVEDYDARFDSITFIIKDYEYPIFMEAFNEVNGVTIISIK